MAVIGPEGDELPVDGPENPIGDFSKGPEDQSDSIMGFIARPFIFICRIPIVIMKLIIRLIRSVFGSYTEDLPDDASKGGSASPPTKPI